MSTPTTITIHTRAEAAATIPLILGFHPTESIVIVGLGSGAPTARLDLDGAHVHALIDALRPAVQAGHWHAGCLIAVFTESDIREAEVVLTTASVWLPGIPVLDAFRVTAGECFGPWEVTGQPVAPVAPSDHPVAASRADLVPDIDAITDPDDLLTRAVSAWKNGCGAAAWMYLDRLEEAVGGWDNIPDRGRRLAALMRSATNPKEADL